MWILLYYCKRRPRRLLTIWGISLSGRIATLALIIASDFQNMGYGSDALKIGLRIAFDELGAHKAEIHAWEFNTRALHVYKGLGFGEEGRRRAAIFHGGRFYNEVSFGMLREEYIR